VQARPGGENREATHRARIAIGLKRATRGLRPVIRVPMSRSCSERPASPAEIIGRFASASWLARPASSTRAGATGTLQMSRAPPVVAWPPKHAPLRLGW
jgi:hypothetical protein